VEEVTASVIPQATTTAAAPKRVEKGVRINIGAAKEKPEADISTEGRTPEIIYDRSDNPYLYDVSGPRKAKNYGKIDNDEVMNVDE
jgi:hypothetical protein